MTFREELRAKFYLITVQCQKGKEFMKLRVKRIMPMMPYASKFMELLRFVLDFVTFKMMKIKRLYEALTFDQFKPIKSSMNELLKWSK